MSLTFYQRITFSLLMHLAGVCVSSVILYTWHAQSGFSAIWLLLFFFSVGLVHRIISLCLTTLQQAQDVILALANGDHTVSLQPHHPLSIQFKRAQETMQTARFTAERKHQFLQSTLLHIDLAVLVCDVSGHVLEANPALTQLMGRHIKDVEALGDFGQKILTTESSSQFTGAWQRGEESDILTVSISRVTIQGQVLFVASLQSIKAELQQKEQQAYKQLTQVITHEVGNTVTPLSSLAETCLALIAVPDLPKALDGQQANPSKSEEEGLLLDSETREDMCLALATIQDRAQHLTHFIHHLKDFNRLPSPQLQSLPVDNLLEGIVQLFQAECRQKNISLQYQANYPVIAALDKAQIDRVLINLLKNAIEAVELKSTQRVESYQKLIFITLNYHENKQWTIEVQDNGNGISESAIHMLFVPFFTTKPEGSGIGLALSRQIMMNHGGDLVCVSKSDGACFRCVFSS